jgi:hypothetical protein
MRMMNYRNGSGSGQARFLLWRVFRFFLPAEGGGGGLPDR